MKKTILFVVDKPNWAYEFMVVSWLPYLFKDYDCYVIYQLDYEINSAKILNKFYRFAFNSVSFFKKILGNTNLKYIHTDGFFYTQNKSNKVYKYISLKGEKELVLNNITHFDVIIEMAFYIQYISYYPFTSDKKIGGIFTDSFPHDGPTYDIKKRIDRSIYNREQFFENYLKCYDHIFVGGGNLYHDYNKITDKVSFVYGIYGEDEFIENTKVGKNESLTIGWTGNPNREMKGFNEYIVPAIEKVRKTGRDIKLKTKFEGSYEELYSFYKDIDLVVIASSADSGPSLYAEACLSSVPVISTKVGLPLLGIKDGINGFFINRSIEDICKVLIKVYDDRQILKDFSKRVKIDYINQLGNDKSVLNVLKVLEE